MTFKINTTTSISNTPNISFSLLINKPTMAVVNILAANVLLHRDGTTLTGTVLVLT